MIEAVIERCAGIDVGKKFVLVCAMTGAAKDEPQTQIKKFGIIVSELDRLAAWLVAEACTHAVMASTVQSRLQSAGAHKNDPVYGRRARQASSSTPKVCPPCVCFLSTVNILKFLFIRFTVGHFCRAPPGSILASAEGSSLGCS
jgi:hypothetical protein